MKRNMACILMVVSITLISYSLKAYAEDSKPIKGSEFIKSYEGKNIKELIEFLGKPNEVKEQPAKHAKPGFEKKVYIWDWNDINKLPVKIIHDLKEGTTPYYVDFIKAITEGGEITQINLKHQNNFLIP
ncbi:MAG: hypothetical protein OEM42_09505 [Deltaproteobacteria bacterium]|nr:hypothetical protein [Deltaproteobacteria bacterium]